MHTSRTCFTAMDFLPETGCSSIAGPILSTRVAIGHDDLQVGTRFGKKLERIGQHAGAVVDLLAPTNRFFQRQIRLFSVVEFW